MNGGGRFFTPNPGKQTLRHAESGAKEGRLGRKSREKAKERQGRLPCVLQAHLSRLFTCKSFLIRGWQGPGDSSRLSSRPVMLPYLRAARPGWVNSALTYRRAHSTEAPERQAPRDRAKGTGTAREKLL